jgi:hypothetical protein
MTVIAKQTLRYFAQTAELGISKKAETIRFMRRLSAFQKTNLFHQILMLTAKPIFLSGDLRAELGMEQKAAMIPFSQRSSDQTATNQ